MQVAQAVPAVQGGTGGAAGAWTGQPCPGGVPGTGAPVTEGGTQPGGGPDGGGPEGARGGGGGAGGPE